MLWRVPIILGVVALIQCKKFHEKITDDDFRILFRTTDRTAVPEYEIAPIMYNLEGSINSDLRMKFNAFGKGIDSYLTPTNYPLAGIDTPIWHAINSETSEMSYRKMHQGILGNKIEYYQSRLNFYSMLVLNDDSGSPCFEGHIDGLTIRSLPAHLQKIARPVRDIQPSNSSQSLRKTEYHLIMKSNLSMSEDAIESAKELIELSDSLYESDDVRNLRMKPTSKESLYLSLMITTDYMHWNKSVNDSDYKIQIIDQLIFWNAVDVRFKYVREPKIRLRIAGIIIGVGRFINPYVYDFTSPDKYDIMIAHAEMRHFWYIMNHRPEFLQEAYDLIVIMTDKTLFYQDDEHGKLNISSAGTLGKPDYEEEVYKSVAIINDRGAYNEVPLATETISRLMGLGYINSKRRICDTSFAFKIRDSLKVSTNKPVWSVCSLIKLPIFFNFQVRPMKILDGLSTTSQRQCQDQGFNDICDQTSKTCQHLGCRYTGWAAIRRLQWGCWELDPALDGTVCSDNGHICIRGRCECVSQTCDVGHIKNYVAIKKRRWIYWKDLLNLLCTLLSYNH